MFCLQSLFVCAQAILLCLYVKKREVLFSLGKKFYTISLSFGFARGKLHRYVQTQRADTEVDIFRGTSIETPIFTYSTKPAISMINSVIITIIQPVPIFCSCDLLNSFSPCTV